MANDALIWRPSPEFLPASNTTCELPPSVGDLSGKFSMTGGSVLKMHTKVLSIAALAVVILFLAGCPPRESIERINRDPARFAGREVTIAGRVVGSWGALGFGGFEIDDGTGRMWVVSEHFGVPGRDARIAVTGRIEQGVTLGGRSFATVMRETQRRHY